METDKEYKLRCFAQKLIDFIENNNYECNNCDCGKEQIHDKDCFYILMNKDIEQFQKELHKKGSFQGGENGNKD